MINDEWAFDVVGMICDVEDSDGFVPAWFLFSGQKPFFFSPSHIRLYSDLVLAVTLIKNYLFLLG